MLQKLVFVYLLIDGDCSEDDGLLMLQNQNSTSASDAGQRPDGPPSTTNHPTGPHLQARTAQPSRRPFTDTVNAEHASSSSALRPSHIAISSSSSRQRKGNREKLASADNWKSSLGEGQVPRSRETGSTWKDVARVLDRLFFWLMLIAMTSCSVMVVLAPVYKQHSAQS